MGLSPSELFPHSETEAPFDARSPHDVHRPSPRRRSVDRAPLGPRPFDMRYVHDFDYEWDGGSPPGSLASPEFVARRMGIRHAVRPLLSWGLRLFRVSRRPFLGHGV